jgi:hypothetical protein
LGGVGCNLEKIIYTKSIKGREKQMKQMIQEKPVQKKKNLKVIALAVVCVVLAASLVGIVAIYLPGQLAEKDNTISSLQAQIDALENQLLNNVNATTYVTQIAYLNSQLSDLNETLTYAYSTLATLQKITQLGSSEVWYQNSFTQDANATTLIGTAEVSYAGYVVVQATASANTTFAEAVYSFGGIDFDFNQTIGASGTALFPVLPGSVEIKIGNVNQNDSNNVTATITHYY